MNSRSFLTTELALLFFVIPILLFLDITPIIKIGSLISAIIYVVIISKKNKIFSFKQLLSIKLKSEWKTLLLSSSIVLGSSLIFMYFWHPEDLFIVVKKKPLLWLAILLFYAILSVIPQELLYRSYFFTRYEDLFKNRNYLIALNIIVFPIAHLMFNNPLVLLVTFIGGIFFTLTYNRTKSLLLTSLEHAIYGNWLFTIGMGEMLAFPMPA